MPYSAVAKIKSITVTSGKSFGGSSVVTSFGGVLDCSQVARVQALGNVSVKMLRRLIWSYLLVGVIYERNLTECRVASPLHTIALLASDGNHVDYDDPYMPVLTIGNGAD